MIDSGEHSCLGRALNLPRKLFAAATACPRERSSNWGLAARVLLEQLVAEAAGIGAVEEQGSAEHGRGLAGLHARRCSSVAMGLTATSS